MVFLKKKILSLILASFMTMTVTSYAAPSVDLEFNKDDFSLSVDAKSLSGINAVTTVSIMENENEISNTNLPSYAYVYKTDSQGNLSQNILLPYAIGSGRIYVYLDSHAFSETKSIVILNENDTETLSLIGEIDSFTEKEDLCDVIMNTEKSETLGLDLSDVSDEVIEDAAYVCFGEIQNLEEITPEVFMNTFKKCMVYAEIKNGGDVDDAMKLYATSFGTTWEEYSAYSQDIRETFGEIFKSAEAGEKKITEIYTDSILLARVKCADSWGDTRDILTENSDYLEIDMADDSDFSDIKNNKRYKVFLEVFSSRDTLDTVDDITECFETAVETTLKSQKESTSGGGGGGGGGSSSGVGLPTGPSVSVSKDYEENIPVSDVKPYVPKEKFLDIKDHYSKEYVENMIQKGIINGYEDGTFRPDSLITRAEISKILSVALKLDTKDITSDFSDVKDGDWFGAYVAAMAKNGYINGYNGQFMPSENLKRQDIAVIMANILKNDEEVEVPEYKDLSDISEYAKESVAKMNALGIMTGSDGIFRPQDGITRAEVAIVVTRLLEILESK